MTNLQPWVAYCYVDGEICFRLVGNANFGTPLSRSIGLRPSPRVPSRGHLAFAGAHHLRQQTDQDDPPRPARNAWYTKPQGTKGNTPAEKSAWTHPFLETGVECSEQCMPLVPSRAPGQNMGGARCLCSWGFVNGHDSRGTGDRPQTKWPNELCNPFRRRRNTFAPTQTAKRNIKKVKGKGKGWGPGPR